MADREELAKIYVQAQADGTDESIAALEPHLADDVLLTMALGPVDGKEAVKRQMKNPVTMYNFSVATWDEPVVDGDTVTMHCTMPLTATLGGFDLTFNYTDEGQLHRILMRPYPAPPLPPSPVALTDEMQQALLEAPANGLQVVVAAVDAEGQPKLAVQNSVIPFSATQLAYWARNLEAPDVKNLVERPRVTCWYRNAGAGNHLSLYGQAAVSTDAAIREQVYAAIPAPERSLDRDQQGGPVLVELDAVDGVWNKARINMQRGA